MSVHERILVFTPISPGEKPFQAISELCVEADRPGICLYGMQAVIDPVLCIPVCAGSQIITEHALLFFCQINLCYRPVTAEHFFGKQAAAPIILCNSQRIQFGFHVTAVEGVSDFLIHNKEIRQRAKSRQPKLPAQ